MKTINKRRAAAATAVAGMVLTPLGLLPMELAHAAGDGSFRANVENNDGDSVPGAKVTLYSTATGAAVGTPKVIAETDDPNTSEDETQSVTFTGLNTGTYLVKVEDPSGKYVTEYSTADEITQDESWAAAFVSLNPRTSGLGELSGTVTQKTDDSYFEARVFVYPDTATQASIDSGDTWHVASTWLYDSDYDYEGGRLRTVSQKWDLKLAPGKYKVRVVDYDSQNCNNAPCTFTRQAWAGGTNADDAKVVTVSSRTTSATPTTALPEDVEPTVSVPGRIQGTVTGAGGAKLDNVQVSLFQKSGEESVSYTHLTLPTKRIV